MDSPRHLVPPQEEERAAVGGGKRKLPSPDGAVRQSALPQPQTRRVRRGQEEDREEEEEQQQQHSSQGGAAQISESHSPQEWQREGQNPDVQRSLAIRGGKKRCLSDLFYLLLN